MTKPSGSFSAFRRQVTPDSEASLTLLAVDRGSSLHYDLARLSIGDSLGITRAFGLAVIIVAVAGCDRSPVLPSPAASRPSTPVLVGPPRDAALTISGFSVTFNPGSTVLRANFTLRETVGESIAILDSILFEESNGGSSLSDAEFCWGDNDIRIAPGGNWAVAATDYCQTAITTKSPGVSASLTVAYKQTDGRPATVRASAGVPR